MPYESRHSRLEPDEDSLSFVAGVALEPTMEGVRVALEITRFDNGTVYVGASRIVVEQGKRFIVPDTALMCAEIDEAKQWTLEAKENLLAFDDTTFYSKLVSGEASAVQAWDGWCEYGRAEDPKNIDFVILDEGSDLWSDTMVVLESSENEAAAYAFIDYILRPEVGKQIVEYTLYKMPNAEVMAAVDPKVIKDYPTLAISPAELFEQETQTDLGEEGTVLWAEAATEIKA